MNNSKFSPDVVENKDSRECLLHAGVNAKEIIEPFALDENGYILHDIPKLRESIDRLSDLIEKYIVIVDR